MKIKGMIIGVLILCTLGLISLNVSSWDGGQVKSIKAPGKEFSEDVLKEGDVIFQSSNSGQSLAIQISTESKYSHVGIIFKEEGEWMVFEAIQPVVKTPLQEFINRGDGGFFAISRFKEEGQVSEEKIAVMKEFFDEVEGKNYDIYFSWSDKAWYCSELVWKMYDAAGIQISDYEKFGDFKLDHPVVQKIVKDRFPKGAPLDETVITPKGIHASDKMKEVYSNYNQSN